MFEYSKKIFFSYLSFLIPLLLFCILGILIFWSESLQLFIINNTVRPAPVILPQASLYPALPLEHIPVVGAGAVAVLDKDSGRLLYTKNDTLRFSPASTTKIMTALVALDYFKPTDILTVKSVIDTQGSGLGLLRGQKMTFQQMLTGALVFSANDAAYTISENYPGGIPAFIAAMNTRAKALQLDQTHFADAAGLEDDNDYTSARDLVRLTAIAMQNKLFENIVKTQYTTVSTIDNSFSMPIKNRNILLGMYGINGVKTGYTEEAGEVLSSSFDIKGHRIYMVVMKSNDRFGDTLTLVKYITATLTYQSIHQ